MTRRTTAGPSDIAPVADPSNRGYDPRARSGTSHLGRSSHALLFHVLAGATRDTRRRPQSSATRHRGMTVLDFPWTSLFRLGFVRRLPSRLAAWVPETERHDTEGVTRC